jgi:hypothetical protein
MKNVITIVFLLFISTNCINHKGKYDNYIKTYKGDGQPILDRCYPYVIYGYESIWFKMPQIDLSESEEKDFYIGTLPDEQDTLKYYVSLVIPDWDYNDTLLAGDVELKIYKDDSIYFSVKSKLSEFNHSTGSINEFTYPGNNMNTQTAGTESMIISTDTLSKWKITFKYFNQNKCKANGWIEIGHELCACL